MTRNYRFFVFAFCLFCAERAFAQFGNTLHPLVKSSAMNLPELYAVDVDEDGDLDVVGTFSNSVVWSENLNGHGDFGPPYPLFEGNFSGLNLGQSDRYLLWLDIDGDGKSDFCGDQHWWKNLGGGQFAPKASIFTQKTQVVGDIDGDGRPDGITASAQQNRLFWQRNLGGGQFAAQATLVNSLTSGLVWSVGDFDKDGIPDFLTTQSNACYWYKGKGNMAFDTVRLFSEKPPMMQINDFNGDGKTDLFVQIGSALRWYEFEGGLTLTLKQVVSNTFKGTEISFGDLDGDGDQDILIGRITTNADRMVWFKMAASGLFESTPNLPFPTRIISTNTVDIKDLNGDGVVDILTPASYLGNGFVWYSGIGGGTFVQKNAPPLGMNYVRSMTPVDLDGDHQSEVLVRSDPASFLLRNNGIGGVLSILEPVPLPGKTLEMVDLDGDGLLDFVTPGPNDILQWYPNLGNYQYGAARPVGGLVTDPEDVGSADLDGDGDMDLFACNGTQTLDINARFYWFINDGNGTFEPILIQWPLNSCSGAESLDVDLDGRLDIVLIFHQSEAEWFRNLGNGTFASGQKYASIPATSGSILRREFIDLDSDGQRDLIFSTFGWGEQKVYWQKNLGNGTFSGEKILQKINSNASYCLSFFDVNDYDLDGDLDVLVSGSYYNRLHFIRNDGMAGFKDLGIVFDMEGYCALLYITSADMNADGKPDPIIFFDDEKFYTISWLGNELPVRPQLNLLQQHITCQNNGTASIATDDYFQVHLLAVAPLLSFDTYRISSPVTTFSPDTLRFGALISTQTALGSVGFGSVPIFLTDLSGKDTLYNFYIPQQSTCSPLAVPSISLVLSNVDCNNSLTPDDPTDDQITFNVQVGAYGFTPALDDYVILESDKGMVNQINGFYANYYYNSAQGVGYDLPLGSAGAGDVILTAVDSNNPKLSASVMIPDSGACPNNFPTSPTMVLSQQSVSCDDAGTPADPTDDAIEIRFLLRDTLLSDSFRVAVLLSGIDWYYNFPYNQPGFIRISMADVTDPAFSLIFSDFQNISIFEVMNINVPEDCRRALPSIFLIQNESFCHDNNSPEDASDDYIQLRLNIGDSLLSNGYSIEIFSASGYIISPEAGIYGVLGTYSLSPGSAGKGTVHAFVSDVMNPNFFLDFEIADPGTCATSEIETPRDSDSLRIFPNPYPVDQPLLLEWTSEYRGKMLLQCWAADGKLLQERQIEKTTEIISTNFEAIETLGSSILVTISFQNKIISRLLVPVK